MKVTRTLEEFYKLNDKDLSNILSSKFKNILKYYPLEDLKAEIYQRMHRKQYIQNYRPFEIFVDTENSIWDIQPTKAKFSTYICTFVFNYIYAYYNHLKPDWLCLSLENYNDNYYCKEDNTRIAIDSNYDPQPNIDLKLDIQNILEYLKSKNQKPLTTDPILNSITQILDQYDTGCTKETLYQDLSTNFFSGETTGLEEILISSLISEAEKKGIIRKEKEKNNIVKYFSINSKRRSLYNLLHYYVEGYKDKEISEKFKMTVAGVGALKRSLRKEIKNYYSSSVSSS